MKIMNTDNISNDGNTILIYGKAGVGKTRLATTLKGKTIILNLEDGLLSLKGKGLDYIDCTRDDEGKLLSESQRLVRFNESLYYIRDNPDYQNVMVDSFTEVADCLLKVLKEEYKEDKNKYAIWGILGDKMDNLIRSFRHWDKQNIILIALEKKEKDDMDRVFYSAMFPGNMTGQKIEPAIDEIFRMVVDIKTEERFLMTGVTKTTMAKDRSGTLDKLEKPDLQAILNKIGGIK